ncbi:lytic murein transglycosylase [Thalassovita mangrovi]|uniref:Murein transglycosylase n=1 Tax=Thalassovita mangrovi TaxID=2692236 RepID=A0A6L8LM41_9RHOB|nr:lytic murein transglycosylase [Thalassovita mangrovi]MYM54189.1 murein transglycosylase [Thalassovita mangrovi]
MAAVFFKPVSRLLPVVIIALGGIAPAPVRAASCGDNAAGFAAWKTAFAREAKAAGVGKKGLAALSGAQYASQTIWADRNQKSFKYSLEKFMQVRGADTIVALGRKRKARNPAFYASLEKTYGVPAGVLLAIHGMETAFGNFMGDSNVVSAITTLAYDCRRSDFFTPHALSALKLVDRGAISPASIGAKHGELGHTQFLPGNILTYGVDGNGDGRIDLTDEVDAMASTANYLRKKGWKPGRGYLPDQPNFKVIKQWNAAGVYQKAIAIMADRIDR